MPKKEIIDITKILSLGKKIGGLIAVIAVFNSVFFYFISNTETYAKFTNLLEHEEKVENTELPYINTTLEEHTVQLQHITSWMNNKDNSMSIGLRVNKEGELVFRAKDKKEYHVYSLPGYEYLFYTDKTGSELIAGFLTEIIR